MRNHHRTQRHARRPGGMKRPSTSPSTSPTSAARRGISPGKDRPRSDGRSTKPRKPRVVRAALTAPTRTARRADRRQPRVHRDLAQAPETQLSPPPRARRPGPGARRHL